MAGAVSIRATSVNGIGSLKRQLASLSKKGRVVRDYTLDIYFPDRPHKIRKGENYAVTNADIAKMNIIDGKWKKISKQASMFMNKAPQWTFMAKTVKEAFRNEIKDIVAKSSGKRMGLSGASWLDAGKGMGPSPLSRSIYEAIRRLGYLWRDKVQILIDQAAPPELEDSTIRMRKWRGYTGTDPLIESGEFRRSVEFSIDGKPERFGVGEQEGYNG